MMPITFDRVLMPRLLLALLLTLSLWPSLATGGDARAYEQGSPLRPVFGYAASGSHAALPSLGGWQLLPRLDTGLRNAERDRGQRSGASGHFRAATGSAVATFGSAERAEAALLGTGVLLLRYEHLPYFATAPPAR